MSIDRTNPVIEPFYFGPERPLYGCYHRPQQEPPRSSAVVLCYPMGEEYIRFHRAFRQLALQLAASGFAVLRFDFYGCGDSAGDLEQCRLAQWQADLGLAIAEARRRSGFKTVGLIGLRLGATLAAIVAAGRDDIAALVLWDPVPSGTAHLQELAALHTSMLRRAHVLPRPPGAVASRTGGSADSSPQEILGFPLGAGLRADIAALDLLALPARPAPQVLLVESNPNVTQAGVAGRLEQLGATVRRVAVASPQLWVWEEGLGKVLVPHGMLQPITAGLARMCPPQKGGTEYL